MTNFYDYTAMFRISTCTFVFGVLLMNFNHNMVLAYHHPGETHPLTIEAAIGTDFNITCYMNAKAFPGKNSSCLYFVSGRTNEALPPENIVVANSSTIVYMVHNASEQTDDYRCKCGPDAIMETKVFVGFPPRPATNFLCRSYDFIEMICNFTKPFNPILTTYKVSYSNDMPNYFFYPNCNYVDRNFVICNISLTDRYQEYYNFMIESSNALVRAKEDNLKQNFTINNFEVMIPSKPGDNIRIDSLTVNSIKLAWLMPNWEKYRLKGLQWEVLVQPENSTILKYDAPLREHNELRLRLNKLPFAHWRYELKLRVRVNRPNSPWSQQLIFPFRTAARRPQRAPLVQPGSFYIDSSETRVTIYWNELMPFEYDGYNFTYNISSVRRDGKLIDLKPLHQEMNLAKFDWQKHSQYDFEIRSRNHMGDSIDASHLTIYPFNRRNTTEFMPQAIHNVYHADSLTYNLTWSKPNDVRGLQSYTVYWCIPKRALPTECRESMFFQQVPVEQLNFTTEKQNPSEEHALNLAVSANYENFNTGLHWTDCTMNINYGLGKIYPEYVASAYSIQVHWSVNGVCSSILDGFNITYCEIANANVAAENATCIDQEISKVAKKSDKKYNITHLKPFTTYKISMYMFQGSKKGKPSDPKLETTLEGAPSPPRQLRVEDRTNTTATIKWLEPSHPNGKIRKYIIMLNNDKREVNASVLTYHFENLESFTAYKVYVLAETIETSASSNDVHFTTAIGYPSAPAIVPTKSDILQWSKPAKPRGRIEFYEVSVVQKRNDDIIRQRISYVVEDTTCDFVKEPTCIGAEYKTIVEVRAVNAALLTHEVAPDLRHTEDNGYYYQHDFNDGYDNNEDLVCKSKRQIQENNDEIKRYKNDTVYRLYKSPWLTLSTYSCGNSYMSKMTTIALVVVAMSLGVMAALYMARKKYNKMANINCTLPAGLETYFTKDAATGFPGDFSGGSLSLKETRAAEDQWISAARMHEFNFRNEHHHLLASIGNDSGYLGGGGGGGIGSVINTGGESGRILSSSLEISNVCDTGEQQRDGDDDKEEYNKDNLKETMHTPSSSVDSLVESTEDSECHNTELERNSPLTIFPSNNGYIKQSMLLQPWQSFTDHNDMPPTPPPAASGYITVQNLNPLLTKSQTNDSAAIPTGYVLQQDLHNFFTNTPAATTPMNHMPQSDNIPTLSSVGGGGGGGYTTLDDLAKLNMNSTLNSPQPQIQESFNATATNPSENASGGITKTAGICGYVTQHDLNLFAQHQQHN